MKFKIGDLVIPKGAINSNEKGFVLGKEGDTKTNYIYLVGEPDKIGWWFYESELIYFKDPNDIMKNNL